MIQIKRLFLAAVLAASLLPRLQAEVLPPEKLLPNDTLVLYTIPDFNKMREVYADSPHGQFWNDPAMHDFKEKFMAKLTSQFISPMERQMGVKFADYLTLPQGQITFAITQNGWQGKEGQSPALLFLLDTKGKSDQLKTNLSDLRKKWVDAGQTIKTEKIRDLDFSVITLSKEDMAKAIKKDGDTNSADAASGDKFENPDSKKKDKQTLYIGQAESLLILGDNPKAIEKVLVRMSGGEIKPLAENPLYAANNSIFHDAQTYGWADTKTFIDVLTKNMDAAAESENPSPLHVNPRKVVTALGLNGLETIALAYTYGPDGTMMNVSINDPDSNRAGLFKILEGEQKDASVPAFVPSDAVKFQRWRLDGKKTWDNIRKIAADISPASVNGIDFMLGSAEGAAKDKDPTFDLKKDLFGNLGDDIISYQKNPKGQTLAEMSAPPLLYLISSPAPERLLSAIRALLVLMPQQDGAPKDRDFLGHKIYSLPLTPAGSENSRVLSYTTSSGYLAVSTDPALLEEYLRSAENPPKPLRDTPGLADASSKVVSKETSLFGYSNESETMRFLFESMKKAGSDSDPLAGLTPLAMAAGMGDTNMKEWIDISLLPTFDKVAKYFNFSVYSFGANSQGLTFKAFAPNPPGFKK